MNKALKRTICITTALFISTFISANKKNDNVKYASYSKGDVYIGTELPSDFYDNPYDVFVLDRRDGKNPDMRVYDSYRITSLPDQEAIIDILLRYEEEYPSNWNRTKESLLREWLVHNNCYELGIKVSHTRHVDFDNEDEETYKYLRLTKNKVKLLK